MAVLISALMAALFSSNACLSWPTVAGADNGSCARAQLDTTTIPRSLSGNSADATGFGAVSHPYNIGAYDVTNAQYAEFLNEVDPSGANGLALYNSGMTTDASGGITFTSGNINGTKYNVKASRDSQPVIYVNWYSAVRFANWLNNGQGSGDTETGAYTLGALGPAGIPLDDASISRVAGSRDVQRVLPSGGRRCSAEWRSGHDGISIGVGYWKW